MKAHRDGGIRTIRASHRICDAIEALSVYADRAGSAGALVGARQLGV